jgi:hypothetical protein
MGKLLFTTFFKNFYTGKVFIPVNQNVNGCCDTYCNPAVNFLCQTEVVFHYICFHSRPLFQNGGFRHESTMIFIRPDPHSGSLRTKMAHKKGKSEEM